MKIIKRIYLEDNSFRIIETEPEYLLLSSFFNAEVQDEEEVSMIKGMIEDVLNGKSKEEGFIGNANTISIKPDKILLNCDFDEELGILELDHESFLEALEQWENFLINVWQKRDQHGGEKY